MCPSPTFPAASEEHLHDEDLQTGHGNHEASLDDIEVEDSLLRAPHSAEVPVLTRTEVLLLPDQCRDLA